MAYQKGKKLLGGGYTSYTVDGKGFFVKHKRYYQTPMRGDIVYFYSSAKKRVAHVGIVIEVTKLKNGQYTIKTVEGNTSSAPGVVRNGGAVAIKTYTFFPGQERSIDGFGRPFFGAETCTVDEFINAAMLEVGYLEKGSNKDLGSKLGNAGMNNYTKYSEWYGMNGVYWCQIFVSWVAYTACSQHQKNLFTGWKQEGESWFYYDDSGVPVKGQWSYINGRWYAFDDSGRMIKGWFKSADAWYYLGEDGGMLSGQWLQDKGKWYYLTDTGAMATSAKVKKVKGQGFDYVGADGVYRPVLSLLKENDSSIEMVC